MTGERKTLEQEEQYRDDAIKSIRDSSYVFLQRAGESPDLITANPHISLDYGDVPIENVPLDIAVFVNSIYPTPVWVERITLAFGEEPSRGDLYEFAQSLEGRPKELFEVLDRILFADEVTSNADRLEVQRQPVPSRFFDPVRPFLITLSIAPQEATPVARSYFDRIGILHGSQVYEVEVKLMPFKSAMEYTVGTRDVDEFNQEPSIKGDRLQFQMNTVGSKSGRFDPALLFTIASEIQKSAVEANSSRNVPRATYGVISA